MADWVQPNDIVCILSENRPEWWIADLATLCLGGVTAPIYPTNPAKDIAYILNDCHAKLLFVSGEEQLAKIRKLQHEGKIPLLQRVIVFDNGEAQTVSEQDGIYALSTIRSRNESSEDPLPARQAQLGSEDLATLIYTSGTTGEPKGVMLSHANLVSNTLGTHDLLDYIYGGERVMLSFLPLSHSFERTAGYYVAIHHGFRVGFAEDISTLVDNMSEVRPSLIVSVPRIYEKVYANVMQSARSGLKKKLLHWAIDVGKRHSQYRMRGKRAPLLLGILNVIASLLVFSKVRKKLGGRLRYAISGGAPLAQEIAHFFYAIGLTIFEGYGLSEPSPVVACNRPNRTKVGSVGLPMPDVELSIEPDPERGGEDGEILVRGPNIMQGYYRKPEATAEVIDADGWFHTGDIGYIDGDGYLYITDRKKELIKTAGGKYVAPQPIENQLKLHPLIEQAVVIGDRRKYCVVLLVPAFEALEKTLNRPLPADRSQLNEDPQVRSLYQAAIDEVNKPLGSWEQIKRFYLLPSEMPQESGELTPSLKVKRRVVDESFKQIIDSLYPPQ
jgi:long-chain acyl-CoA synthetase